MLIELENDKIMSGNFIVVPLDVMEIAVNTLGNYFEPLCGTNAIILAQDHLNVDKALRRGEILQKYTSLESKKLLEIGSGFGVNIAAWIKHFNVDGYGVELGSEGFNDSYDASRKLLDANGIDSNRILDARGENLPFDDESFDIVYSANVLEHTDDPIRVLTEAVRILKKGGILYFEIPNYLSYFEGHYMIFQPPILWKPMLPFWVAYIFRRDPTFARTLQTQINPVWCRKVVNEINHIYPIKLDSLGEDTFLSRLSQPFNFETQQVKGKLSSLISILQKINFKNWIGRSIVSMQGHYPIYLVLHRE
ncbi:MAG: methyltransferase domain-containing protein [Proteobacteria bacterium]|nr:methyltransferase domain-containing protein [Pseudomonadota bacterium]